MLISEDIREIKFTNPQLLYAASVAIATLVSVRFVHHAHRRRNWSALPCFLQLAVFVTPTILIITCTRLVEKSPFKCFQDDTKENTDAALGFEV